MTAEVSSVNVCVRTILLLKRLKEGRRMSVDGNTGVKSSEKNDELRLCCISVVLMGEVNGVESVSGDELLCGRELSEEGDDDDDTEG